MGEQTAMLCQICDRHELIKEGVDIILFLKGLMKAADLSKKTETDSNIKINMNATVVCFAT